MNLDTLNHVFDVLVTVLLVASAAMPLAQKIASMTATKTDDEIVEKVATFIHDVLAYLPALRIGNTLSQKAELKAAATVTTPVVGQSYDTWVRNKKDSNNDS